MAVRDGFCPRRLDHHALVFEAGSHPRADAVLEKLTKPDGEAVVPVLWRYEVGNVLSRARRKTAIPQNEVTEFIRQLQALPIRVDLDFTRILSDVHDIAVAFGLTSYDAAYLELAKRRDIPIATLDDELISACSLAGVRLLDTD